MSALCQSRLRPRGSTASATACRSRSPRSSGRPSSWREDAAHVGVHGGQVVVVREDEHGARRVRADAGQRAQPVERARQLGRGAQGARRRRPPPRTPAAAAPGCCSRVPASAAARRPAARRRGSRGRATPRSHSTNRGDHARHLRLLQHDLADEDRVGVGGAAPGQVAAVLRVPGEEARLQRRARRGDGGAGPACSRASSGTEAVTIGESGSQTGGRASRPERSGRPRRRASPTPRTRAAAGFSTMPRSSSSRLRTSRSA